VDTSTRRLGTSIIELVVVMAIIAILTGLLIPAVQMVRHAALRSECANRMKQIGMAAHQFHGAHAMFPSGVYGKSTPTPSMSWLTAVLPYIEQGQLWAQSQAAYRSSRSPFVNPPHIGLDTVVRAFICPIDGRIQDAQVTFGLRVAFTSFLGVSGTNKSTRDGVFYLDSRVRIADVTDGTSTTLLVAERPPSADLFAGWWYAGQGTDGAGTCDMLLGTLEPFSGGINVQCSPDPVGFISGQLDNQCDVLHFWSLHSGGGHFAFADGSVRFLRYSGSQVLPALGTRAGGESVQAPD
jgi:prepilin-type processing-associated H-X9-DG protein